MQRMDTYMGKVGISGLRPPGGDWRDVLEMAALVDGLGYSCITTGEAWGQDAFTSLAQIAAVTSRIRIGTSIVPIFARSPANMAMTALNMDLMSEGRFFLGIGASGKLVIEDFHGERFRKPLTRMPEYIDIIRKASRGERIEHDGEFLPDQARFRIGFQPYRSHLPIYIASLSPPSLRLTGRAGRRLAANLSWLRQGWTRRWRTSSPGPTELAAHWTMSPSRRRCRCTSPTRYQRRVIESDPHIAFYIGGMGVSSTTSTCTGIGFGEESDRIREAYLSRDREIERPGWSLTRWSTR